MTTTQVQMPALQGTDKQIIWANDIRDGWIKTLVDIEYTASERVRLGDFGADYMDIVRNVTDKMRATIINMIDAKKFIDQRQAPLRDKLYAVITQMHKAAQV